MKRFLVIISILLFHQIPNRNLVQAQGLCSVGGGGFTVDKAAGCNPLSIQVTNTTNVNAQFVEYYLTYSPTIPGTNGFKIAAEDDGTTAMTYNVPAGTYTLLQRVFRPEGFGYFCTPIKVYSVAALTATTTSCGGGKIKLTLENNTILAGYDYVSIEWGDGISTTWNKGDDLTQEHVYSNTSTSQVIKLQGQYAPGTACPYGQISSIPVVFQQPQLSVIAIKSLEMRADGSLMISYTGVAAVATEIYYSEDNGATYKLAARRTSGGSQIYRQAGLNSSKAYLVKLSSTDLCGGKIDTEPVSSMTIAGTSGSGANVLNWNKFPADPDFKEYQLIRDGTPIDTIPDINQTTYNDIDVQCDDNYEYQILAFTNKITSTSAPVTVKTVITNPQPLTGAFVSVASERSVQLHADVPGGGRGAYTLTVDRAENGSSTFKRLVTLSNESDYSDLDVRTSEKSYCYKFGYQNACGQRLPATAPICSILLTMQIPNMSWTAEKPFLDDISSYDIIRTGDVTGQSEINADLRTTYLMSLAAQTDQKIEFKIRANSASGNFSSLSNAIVVNSNVSVYVPGAFSPNGDGYNDVLEVKGTQFQSFNMSVLNRWGQVIFNTSSITDSWDGTYKGKEAPVGSYVYKLVLVNSFNQTTEKSGTFMLLR